jgi:DNA-binding MarR family transcriptional regulator
MIHLPERDLPPSARDRVLRRAQRELRREVVLKDAPVTRVLARLEMGTLTVLSACMLLWAGWSSWERCWPSKPMRTCQHSMRPLVRRFERFGTVNKTSEKIGVLLPEVMSMLHARVAGDTLAVMHESGLTLPQIVVLHILQHHGGQSVSFLGGALGCPRAPRATWSTVSSR